MSSLIALYNLLPATDAGVGVWIYMLQLATSVGFMRPLPTKSPYSQGWNLSLRNSSETSCVHLSCTDLECLSEVRKMANNDSGSELNLAFAFTFVFPFIYLFLR